LLATDQWREEGPWLLLLILPVAAMAFRRGLIVCLVFLMLPMPQVAHAFSWNDLWLNGNQQGQQKLAAGQAKDAAEYFEDPQWRGVSNYQSGNYPASAEDFSESVDADSLYNLGNALAQSSRYEAAIDAYDKALQLAPDDDDTRYNRDLVANLLKQQQQNKQQNKQQNGEQSDGKSGGNSRKSEADKQSDQQGKDGNTGDSDEQSGDHDSSGTNKESNEDDMRAVQKELQRAAEEARSRQGQESESKEMTEAQMQAMRHDQEQTQAMEQWLRRVENDPGGLLRRKFRYQYQRQGKDQDGNSVWPDDEVEPW